MADVVENGEIAGAAASPGGDDDAVMRIVPTSRPPGLAIAGEIDEDTYPALVRSLEGVGNAAEIHIDLAAVRYCDLAGLRAIVQLAAGRTAASRRLVLHGLPRELRAVLSIVGWDATPGLVIDEGTSRGFCE